ncbi:MAG TPA: Hsp20/alpha crystallin family protein [Thermoplasmata archaeon]
MDETGKRSKRLKDIADLSRQWDAEYMLGNYEEEMLRLEGGLDHMVWDVQERRVTACVKPLPITPRFEVEETEKEFVLKAKLPEISREDIRLRVNTSSVEVLACKNDVVCRPYYVEVESPSVLDPDSADAELSDGVLRVKVRKVRKKRLDIR